MPNETDVLKNEAGLFIEIFHIPSGKSVSLKSFLTKLSDTYTSNWNEEQVYGRPDPLTTFNSTKRVMNVGFEVIAEDIEEAIQNQMDLGMIARFQYPAYSKGEQGATGISGAPLLRLKFLNLIWNAENRGKTKSYNYHSEAEIAGLVGKMDSFANVVNADSGFHQDSESKALYPVSYTINFNFLVLHTHQVGWSEGNFMENGYPYGHVMEGDGIQKIHNTTETTSKIILSVQEKERIAAQEKISQQLLSPVPPPPEIQLPYDDYRRYIR